MMNKGKKGKFLMNRRSFLVGSAALSANLVLLGTTGCSPASPASNSEQTESDAAQTSKVEYKYQACPRNCHDTCTLISEVVDGRIVRVTGDPTHPITAGTPCVKGHTYKSVVYHPDRILYPMKRAGKKGEGKWERISWDEAYDTISTKLKEIIDEYGSEAILPYSYSGNLGIVNNYGVPFRFWNKIGASNLARKICNPAGDMAMIYTYGQYPSIDPETYSKTKMYISWGCNEAATGVHFIKFINQARDNGAKLVVINPVRTPLASQADFFIQPKPGTDAALALGVANVLINEGLYDKDFVNNYTLGFDKLVEKVNLYPLDKVEQITGVPADTIREFARMYAEIKPSILRMGYGIQRNTNGGNMLRAVSLLPALIGTVGTEDGGWIYMNTAHWKYNSKNLTCPELLGDRKVRTINMNELGKALTGELETTAEKPVKALIVYNANPLASSPNTSLIQKGLEREDLFTVVFDPFITDTADYADLILPAATFMEYDDFNFDYLGWYIRLNTPAIEPLGESKSNLQFFFELAQKMGYTDDCFKESPEDVIRGALEVDDPVMKDVTYEALKEKNWIKIDLGAPFADHKFPTPSGKIEFYSEKLGENYDPVAEHYPLLESEEKTPELYAKYPLHLLSPAIPQLLNSQFHNIPQIYELISEPIITMNIVDAKARNISDGDLVEAFNDRGKAQFRVKISEEVQPGVAATGKVFWNKLVSGGNAINRLTSDTLGDMDGVSTFHTNLIQIKKI